MDLNPGGSSIAYATSKAGLIHLTRCLAMARAGALQRAVLKRAVSVEDVADQVLAFCRSDSVTGQTLNIDAGVFFH
jgi:3-oxoacyl-[acyl-carrier protein] reductase